MGRKTRGQRPVKYVPSQWHDRKQSFAKRRTQLLDTADGGKKPPLSRQIPVEFDKVALTREPETIRLHSSASGWRPADTITSGTGRSLQGIDLLEMNHYVWRKRRTAIARRTLHNIAAAEPTQAEWHEWHAQQGVQGFATNQVAEVKEERHALDHPLFRRAVRQQ